MCIYEIPLVDINGSNMVLERRIPFPCEGNLYQFLIFHYYFKTCAFDPASTTFMTMHVNKHLYIELLYAWSMHTYRSEFPVVPGVPYSLQTRSQYLSLVKTYHMTSNKIHPCIYIVYLQFLRYPRS